MKTEFFVHRKFVKGESDAKLFGGFLEHLGRAIYTGIYEPGHPQADEDGFRKDVMELIQELGMPITRYPGGNFVSGFDWRDSIGPREKRPVRADYAWFSLEPNEMGLHEFIKWSRKVGTEPYYAVNAATGSIRSALDLVEYCNANRGTRESELRKANGSPDPFGIRYWCIGNEMDSDNQLGHQTGEEYGRSACEFAKAMKWVDPSIKVTVCGSSYMWGESYGKYDEAVLRHTYNYADYLSLHLYFRPMDQTLPQFLSSAEHLDRFLDDAIAHCDAVKGELHSSKTMMISLDEWNIWYRTWRTDVKDEWKTSLPILEEVYDMTDVVVMGSVLCSILDHADRVKIACLAQSVNVLAPILTTPGGKAWRQTIFYPFALTSRYGRGKVLRFTEESPTFEGLCKRQSPYLRATAVYREEANEVTFFAVNRSPEESQELSAAFEGFNVASVVDAQEIANPDHRAVNTCDAENVRPEPIEPARYTLDGCHLSVTIKPFSWNMFRLKLKD